MKMMNFSQQLQIQTKLFLAMFAKREPLKLSGMNEELRVHNCNQ